MPRVRLFLLTTLLGFASVADAHVVFAPPKAYQHPTRQNGLDMSPQKQTYLRLGERAYGEAGLRVLRFAQVVDEFLAEPNAERLASSRREWVHAREAYSQTEIFRFNDGPIDAPAQGDRKEGPEPHINAWPVDEATIDYVIGEKRSGLVSMRDFFLSAESIRARDQVDDESAVIMGWHAIEFLLWGQDTQVNGPGQRSHRDYLPGDPIRERRRAYLRTISQALSSDISSVAQQWQADGAANFRSQLEATADIEVVGRALHGAASFAAIELYGERFSVALDSGSQEDEHSCFSDTSHLDLQYGLRGIGNLLHGEYAGEDIGTGLLDVVTFKDRQLGERLRHAHADATRELQALFLPFDQLILKPVDSPERLQAERALARIRELGQALKASAEVLGIQIVVPGI